MVLWKFLAFTFAACAVWCGGLASIGYGLGSSWHRLLIDFSFVGYVAAGLVAVVGVVFIFHRLRAMRLARLDLAVAEPFPPVKSLTDETRGRTDLSRDGASSQLADASTPGRVPLISWLFPKVSAAKVPEVIFAFWIAKLLTTAGGEATSDFLKVWGNLKGGATEVGFFVVGLILQFGTRRYQAFAYWFFAFAIAIFGTWVSDFLHLDVGIPYAGTTLLWTAILIAIFALWYRSEGTLSIHSITTPQREIFYWSTVFATFALGTALGDFTAISLNLGYLASGIFFGVVILLPALAWRGFGLNSIAAFWMSYVVTRPLGASFADYISKPRNISGIGFGNGQTAVVFAAVVVALVAYLAIARPDIQEPHGEAPDRRGNRVALQKADGKGEPEPAME